MEFITKQQFAQEFQKRCKPAFPHMGLNIGESIYDTLIFSQRGRMEFRATAFNWEWFKVEELMGTDYYVAIEFEDKETTDMKTYQESTTK